MGKTGLRRTAALLLFVALLFLSGCEKKQPAQETGLLVGFAQIGSESGWRIGNTRSIQEAAERRGIRLMTADANQMQEKEISAIRSFIAYNVDVIVFVPIVEDGWENVLQEAKKAGIPVILSDRQVADTLDPSLYSAYVGADFHREGVLAAEFLLRKTAELPPDTPVRIVQLTGTEFSSPALQREQGFLETLERDSRFVLLDSVSGDFLKSKGKEGMKELLRRHEGEIDVLFSHNDAMAYGAIEAMEEAGLRPGQDILIISVDGEQEAIDLLRAGKINCVVECTPMLGDLVMDLAEALAAGKDVPPVTYPEETVFTEDDDLSSLPPRGY